MKKTFQLIHRQRRKKIWKSGKVHKSWHAFLPASLHTSCVYISYLVTLGEAITTYMSWLWTYDQRFLDEFSQKAMEHSWIFLDVKKWLFRNLQVLVSGEDLRSAQGCHRYWLLFLSQKLMMASPDNPAALILHPLSPPVSFDSVQAFLDLSNFLAF